MRLINQLYLTRIIAEDYLAQRITSHESELQRRLKKGEAEAVQIIALCGRKKVRSFASKYARFHNPAAFPIRDSYVDLALKHLGLKCPKEETIAEDYENFRIALKDISDRLGGASFDEIDQYLWLRGQKVAAEKGKKEKLNSAYGAQLN